MMVRILCVMTSGLKRDGITSSQIEYFKHMDMCNLKVDIASVNEPENDVVEEFKRLGCNVVQLPNRLKNTLEYIRALNNRIKEVKYDVVHVHGSSSLMAIELMVAKRHGVSLRIAHSRNTTCSYKVLDTLLRPIFYCSYNYALACGNDAGEWLFKNRSFRILHNGKDLNKFSFDDNVRKHFRNELCLDSEIAIGFVGSLSYQKNISFILNLFDKYRQLHHNVHLFMMGEGSDRAKIESFIHDKHLENCIHLTGRIDNINEMLQAMDVMILPSRYEGLPNVVLEWQIAGLPCIISDRITQECILTDFVYTAPIDRGLKPWIDVLELILSNQPRRKDHSDEAIIKMKEEGFDIENSTKTLQKIYLSSQKNRVNGYDRLSPIANIDESIRLRIRNKIFLPFGSRFRNKKLKNKDFTIISNNCWGGTVYESYNIKKKSPTVGMFIMPDDYLKLLSDLPYYFSQKLVFISPDESKWKKELSTKRNWGTYLIAKLSDIELHMLHYHDKNSAVEKWNRRLSRVNYNRLIVKFNDQNGCQKKHIDAFWRLPYKNKLCFVSSNYLANDNRSICIKQPTIYRNGICASREPYGKSKYINLTEFINSIQSL